MKKGFLASAIALMAVVSVVSAQEVQQVMRVPAGTQIHNLSARNTGTLVYQNDFLEPDPDVTNCGPGATCESCGDFYTFSIWSTSDRRYLSDDITLGAGPRQLTHYNFMVCGLNTASTQVDITSELWTINLNGNPVSQPGAPIANTQAVTSITVDTNFACFIIDVKVTPGTTLPESFHIVLTSSLQSTATTGTFVAVLDATEYGVSQDRFRQTAAGIAPPHANTNTDWAGASFFGGGTCPLVGGTDCTTGCVPFGSIWAHVFAEGACGNGVVDPGEACDSNSPCCVGCQFASASVVCRPSTGLCDPAENCTGQSDVCPADTGFSVGVECRPAVGACDIAEFCDGTSADCPPNQQVTQCINGDGCCPAGCDPSNDNDCITPGVPTVSEWGLALLTLIGVVVGAVVFSRKANAADRKSVV